MTCSSFTDAEGMAFGVTGDCFEWIKPLLKCSANTVWPGKEESTRDHLTTVNKHKVLVTVNMKDYTSN